MSRPIISVVMGSDSDLETMRETSAILKKFGVPHELRVISAHRSPNHLVRYVRQSEQAGVRIFIAGAGAAAALPGAVAALTIRPVLGVPLPSSHLNGLDALLAIVQMPAGTPAASLAIGTAGARNAAILAVQILALSNPRLSARLTRFKQEQEKALIQKDSRVKKQYA